MILHGELAIGSLQGCGIGVELDAQSVVVVLHGFARCPHGSVSKVGLNRRPEARGGRIAAAPASRRHRSEERRVGEEYVHTCRIRWSRDPYKQQTQHIIRINIEFTRTKSYQI